jgi:hypothetical protein
MVRSLPLLLSVALPLGVTAGPYGPFEAGESHAISLNRCANAVDVRQVHPPLGTVDFSRAGSDVTLRLQMVGIDYYEAQVFSRAAPVGEAVKVVLPVTTPTDIGVDTAICDDFNNDGITDFVIALWRHGNGLGASFYDRLIALSSGKTYRYWVIPTMDPSAEDFVTLGTDERIRMVTRQFVQKSDGDEQRASYFVFDLWAFNDGEVVPSNSVDPRFPKWVRYTSEPNRRSSSSLTERDKERLRPAPQAVEAVP